MFPENHTCNWMNFLFEPAAHSNRRGSMGISEMQFQSRKAVSDMEKIPTESESFHPLFLPFSPLRSASCVRQEELQTAAPPAHPHENAPIYVPKSVRPLPPLPGKQHRFRCYHPIPD